MADLFKEIVPSILKTGQDVLTDEKDYVPFVVNRAISFHYDCILHANQMNINNSLSNQMQYDYLRNAIRKRSRPFQPWVKGIRPDNLQLIKDTYGLSNEKAIETLSLLSDDQLEAIRYSRRTGGLERQKDK